MARKLSASTRKQRKKDQAAAQKRRAPQQGGRFRSTTTTDKNARSIAANIAGDLARVDQIRAERAGLSQSELQRFSDSQRQASQFQQRAQAQAAQSGSLASQQATAQARIKATSLAKKNERILQELEKIRQAERALGFANISSSVRSKLRRNFQDKRRQLAQDLDANQRQQLTILNRGFNRSRGAAIERQITQRAQQVEQLQFQLRQAQGRSGEQRTADPLAQSLARTPGSSAQVRGIAARLGQSLASLAELRREQGELREPSGIVTQQGVFAIPSASSQNITPLGLGVTQNRKTSSQDITGFLGPIERPNILTGFEQTTPAQKQGPPKPSDPIQDALEGFSAPFVNIGKVFAAAPEAVRRDVERFQRTGQLPTFKNPVDSIFNPQETAKASAGEAFFQKEVSRTLQPTALDVVASGGRVKTGRSPTFDVASGIGEAALILSPLAAGKVPKPIAGLFRQTPKKVKPQTQAPTIESIAKGVAQTKPKSTSKPKPPRNVFAQDVAEPAFVKTFVNLGKGTTRTPEGGVFPSFTFGKPPGGKPGGKTFSDPKPRSGERIVVGKDGLFQIQKTKIVKAKQKSQFEKTTINLGLAKVVSKKKDKISGAILPKGQKKTKAQTATEQFFRDQAKSAKKRQQDVLFGVVTPESIVQKPGTRTLIIEPTKQGQRTQPQLLSITKPGSQQKQTTVTPLIQSTAQDQIFPVVPVTTPVTTFINPIIETAPPRPIIARGGLLPFFIPGGGGGADPFGRGGRFGKRFLISNLDPLRAGVISAANVPDLLQGGTSAVFSRGEKLLARERKRQGISNTIGGILSNPLGNGKSSRKRKSKKGKKKKSVLDDPFGGF